MNNASAVNGPTTARGEADREPSSLVHACYGHETDGLRTCNGLVTDMQRACDGLHTVKRRSSCFRGTPVERAGVCSSVVRSAFVRRSVASCVAFVLCWFVWRSCAAAHRVKRPIVDVGASTIGHGNGRFATRGGLSTGQRRTSDGRRTGGHSSDADILRHSEMGGGAAADLPRTGNGHATGLSQTIPLRTCNGRHTGLPTGF